MRVAALFLALALPSACLVRRTTLYDGHGQPGSAQLSALAGQPTPPNVPPALVVRSNASARLEARGLAITFAGNGGSIEAAGVALGLPSEARGYSRLEAVVENGPAPAYVELAVIGARGRLVDGRALGAHHTALLSVALADLPLAATARAPYAFQKIRLSSRGSGARGLVVRELALKSAGTSAPPMREPIVDGFGQRVSGDWPGKARSADDLRAAAATETRALATPTPVGDRDPFGGWSSGPSWQETGYFSLERDGDGRHWLVDPQGHAFWSVGVAAVRTLADATPVRGREPLFAALPDPDSTEGRQVYLPTADGPGLAFYRWNVLRKWGDIGTWRERTLDRLTRWGFNTVGALSVDPEVIVQRRVPHTRTLHTFALGGVARTPGGFPDVFDERWGAAVDQMAADLAPARENPWLLGTFVDEEPSWQELRLLEVPLGSPMRARWAAFLQDRHGTVTALGNAWGSPVASWEAASAVPASRLRSGRARDDQAEFEGLWAQTYFRIIAAALKRHAPNHLYLGCRFAGRPPANDAIARAAGAHVDLLTVNDRAVSSSAAPVDRQLLDRWHALAGGKPILIGAHGTPLAGPRQPLEQPGARAAGDRRSHTGRVLTALASIPYVVGAHWARWVDGPLAGGAPDGDNRVIGLVDVTDLPHEDLVAAMREVTGRIYEFHNTAR